MLTVPGVDGDAGAAGGEAGPEAAWYEGGTRVVRGWYEGMLAGRAGRWAGQRAGKGEAETEAEADG